MSCTVEDMSKAQLIAAIVATYTDGADWDRFYGSWNRESLRNQLRKVTAHQAAKRAEMARKAGWTKD